MGASLATKYKQRGSKMLITRRSTFTYNGSEFTVYHRTVKGTHHFRVMRLFEELTDLENELSDIQAKAAEISRKITSSLEVKSEGARELKDAESKIISSTSDLMEKHDRLTSDMADFMAALVIDFSHSFKRLSHDGESEIEEEIRWSDMSDTEKVDCAHELEPSFIYSCAAGILMRDNMEEGDGEASKRGKKTRRRNRTPKP